MKVIYLSKINTVHIVNVSEVYYGWGVDKKSKYPVNTSAVFPNERRIHTLVGDFGDPLKGRKKFFPICVK